jgi:hypothetical protein
MRALLALLLLTLSLPLAGAVASARYEDKPLPAGLGPTGDSRVEPTFGAVASALADRPGEVRCWSRTDWARINGEFVTQGDGTENLNYVSGFYRPGTGRIHLAPIACVGLVALHYKHAQPTSGKLEGTIALGVETLAHESMHMRGFPKESTAECYAEQLVAATARKLGAPPGYATRLQALSWAVIYPSHPARYLSPECRDGGKLDLNARSHAFP